PPAVVGSKVTANPVTINVSPLLKKLDAIIIPELDFNNLELDKVVQALHLLSAQSDPATEGTKGVNIILNEENPKQTVKIQLSGLSLHRVLDIITQKI